MTSSRARALSLGAFGVDLGAVQAEHEMLRAHAARAACQIDEALGPGSVAAVTGPSGAGKTSTLRALRDRLRERGQRVVSARLAIVGEPAQPSPARIPSILDLIGAGAEDAMGALSAAGLAEARLFALRPDQLSAGQRARFELAVAMHRALRAAAGAAPVTLLVDEFASGLDELGARGLACSFGRWVCRSPVRAVLAGARLDIEAIGPHLVVELQDSRGGQPDSAPIIRRWPGPPRNLLPLTIERGMMADYESLAPYHYAAGRPGPVCRVLRARDGATGALTGVLVVSRPTLNARWRRIAWPGEYEDPDLRARARRINADIRVISRLIVEPRLRGCGVGTALVRRYLAEPLTPRTEAVTAMGAICPVFERAGMAPVRLAQRPQDGRLARFLQTRRIGPERLAELDHELDNEATRELRMWANASRRTRGLLEQDTRHLCREAARALLAEPVAYVKVQS